MKKIKYNIFSGFPFPEVQEIFPWQSCSNFRAWPEKCRLPFQEIQENLSFQKIQGIFLVIELENSVSGNITTASFKENTGKAFF